MKVNYNYLICFFTLLVISMNSCTKVKPEKWRHIKISPLDKTQVVTVITKGNKRYFMNGEHAKVPNDNYLLLDLSKVDRLGDGFSICWNDPVGYNWKIASTYATLIENRLDTSKYLYYQPLDKNAQAISDGYKKDNCGNFLIRENREPWGNLTVQYVQAQ